MKRAVLLTVAGLVVCLAFAYGAEAQMAGQKGMMKDMGAAVMGGGMPDCGCGMPQCGMTGGMMPGRGMMQGRGMTGRGMMGHHRMMHKCLQRLDLNASQKQQVREIKTAAMKKVIHKRADMQIAKIELNDLLSKDTVDMKAVAAKVKQIEGLKADMRLALIEAKVEVKAILTPQQRQKLTDMMGGCFMTGEPMMESNPLMGDTEEEMQPPMERQDEDQPGAEQMQR